MSNMTIAVADSVFTSLEPAERVFAEISARVQLASNPSPEEILDVARHADGLMVTFAKIDKTIINELRDCRVIGRFGIGVDNIDISAATAAGIQICYVPDYCLDEVSDHAMALLLGLARKVMLGDDLIRAGRWEGKATAPIARLRGGTIGLMGLGKIPQALVPKAQALGLQVIAHDPFVDPDVVTGLNVELVSFDDLLSRSNYISIHAPLTKDTRGIFGADTFRRMRSDALLVNTARGPLIDELALADALDQGEIAGAALDVLVREPPESSCPLLNRDDVILTPHIAYYSDDAMFDLQTKAAKDVASVLSGRPPRYPFNSLPAKSKDSSI